MMPDEIAVEIDTEGAHEPEPRSTGDDPHTVHCKPAGADDEWYMFDLEWRAEEFAAVDAHERGLNFA